MVSLRKVPCECESAKVAPARTAPDTREREKSTRRGSYWLTQGALMTRVSRLAGPAIRMRGQLDSARPVSLSAACCGNNEQARNVPMKLRGHPSPQRDT